VSRDRQARRLTSASSIGTPEITILLVSLSKKSAFTKFLKL